MGKAGLAAAMAVMAFWSLASLGAEPAAAPGGMVLVPAGSFLMGSPADAPGQGEYETPQHEVSLDAFRIGACEVTVGEFRDFVAATGYVTEAEGGKGGVVCINGNWVERRDASWKNSYFSQTENDPVVLVTWYDAIAYCNWRSETEGLEPVYTLYGRAVVADMRAGGYRLPTEAEWEYAARGGPRGKGFVYAGSDDAGAVAWTSSNAGNTTHPVGGKAPNELGLYDMSGNVWEFCWDCFGLYPATPQENPQGGLQGGGSWRVARGGSIRYDGMYLRVAFRSHVDPGKAFAGTGFRLARRP